MRFSPLLLALCVALAGCSSIDSHKDPAIDLAKLKRIHVEHRLADGHGIDEMIARELQSYGYEVSTGPLTMMPPKVDAIISYEDVWTFDFTSYMIQLNIWMRDARTDKPVSDVANFHPTVVQRSPVAMVHATVAALLHRKP